MNHKVEDLAISTSFFFDLQVEQSLKHPQSPFPHSRDIIYTGKVTSLGSEISGTGYL